MRKIICYDCGKTYDYDVDDFCPRCGAYTQPARGHRINAWGDVVRVEGINEVNHKGSFVHAELHEENRERKGTFLEVEAPKKRSKKMVHPKRAASRPIQMAPPLGGAGRAGEKAGTSMSLLGAILAAALVYIIKAILD